MWDDVTYEPKISVFYYVLASLSAGLALAAVLLAIFEHAGDRGYVALALLCAAALSPLTALVACVRLRVRFVFKRDCLQVKGVLKKREIGYQSIGQVGEESSFFAFYYPGYFQPATALSMDQVMIRYGAGKTIYISSKDKQGFLQELERRAPDIRIQRKRARGRL
ncbi:MAG: PH domain-containing protein [Methanomassiliicoccaceae archaeon]|nr:PH domain-containing protein [Methanomassiliicoccaceae archaeon]